MVLPIVGSGYNMDEVVETEAAHGRPFDRKPNPAVAYFLLAGICVCGAVATLLAPQIIPIVGHLLASGFLAKAVAVPVLGTGAYFSLRAARNSLG